MSSEDLMFKVSELIVKKCGDFARKEYEKNKSRPPESKPKHGINFESSNYTPADLKLEQMLKNGLNEIKSQYGFLGEEECYQISRNEKRVPVLHKGESWVADAIDGSLAFATGVVPTWYISLGLVENDNGIILPKKGFLYSPCLDELLYNDGENSFCVDDASDRIDDINKLTNGLEPKLLTQIIPDVDKTGMGIVAIHESALKANLSDRLAVAEPIGFVHQVVGVLRGEYDIVIMKSSIWDGAACLPLVKNLGVKVYDFETKKEVKNFSVDDYGKEIIGAWKLKKYYGVCHESIKDFMFDNISL